MLPFLGLWVKWWREEEYGEDSQKDTSGIESGQDPSLWTHLALITYLDDSQVWQIGIQCIDFGDTKIESITFSFKKYIVFIIFQLVLTNLWNLKF